MGLLDLFKKKTTAEKIAAKRVNCVGESMDHLDAEGNLPFGWVVHNRNYVDMIDKELNHFRQLIRDAKTVTQKYGAYKSYVLYLMDGLKHYTDMGECVGKYFEVHICGSVEAQEYYKKMEYIEENMDVLIEEEKQMIAKQQELADLKEEIYQNLKGHDGMLQSEFVNMFYESKKNDCRFLLTELEKEKRIERTKAGRSYLLYIKKEGQE